MRSGITAIAIMAAVCAIPNVSMAAPPGNGSYVSGFAGVTFPLDSDVTDSFFSEGSGSETFEDRLKFDPGFYIGGAGGYDFGLIRLEGEVSYKQAEIDSIATNQAGFRFQDPNGDVGALAVMFNAFLDLHNGSPVTPYIGGGIGFANVSLSDTLATNSVTSVRDYVYFDDDDTVFAYQGGAGVEISLNRSLSVDLGYRYFGTSRSTFDSYFDSVTEMKFESHNAMAGLRVKF